MAAADNTVIPSLDYIYRLLPSPAWQSALSCGHYAGGPLDAQDGFLHMSTAAQTAETAKKYFKNSMPLTLIQIDLARLSQSPGLRWDAVASRNGELFAHLYGEPLQTKLVTKVWELEEDSEGYPIVPDLMQYESKKR